MFDGLLNMEDFVNCLNGRFMLHPQDGDDENSENSIVLQLIDVSPLGDSSKDSRARTPFSLLFKGPVTPALNQKTHLLKQKDLGDLPIFLVPLGPEEDGMIYEAIFN